MAQAICLLAIHTFGLVPARMATEEMLSPLHAQLLSKPTRKLEYDERPEPFTAMFLPPSYHVVKQRLPTCYAEVTDTSTHGWLERALNSIVFAFVEETKSHMKARQNMWLAFK